MTTNRKGVPKERLFAFVKRRQHSPRVRNRRKSEGRKTRDSTASTYQRLAKARLDL